MTCDCQKGEGDLSVQLYGESVLIVHIGELNSSSDIIHCL